MIVKEKEQGLIPKRSMNPLGILKKVIFLYRKGFWKFWLIYLISFLIIKGFMLGFYWLMNYFQNNTFIGFSLAQSEYYILYQDVKVSTLDPLVSEDAFITKSFLIYFLFEILYQALLAIPLAISILLAKNIFDKTDESVKKQIKDVSVLLIPLLIIGIITNFLVSFSTYFWYIPGLVIMTLTSLVYPVALEEKLKPIATMKRSYQLAKEQFFNILGIIVIVLVAQLIILGSGKAFATLLVYSPATADKVLSVYDSIYVLYQYDIVQSLVYSIVAPFTAISAFVMYREAVTIRNLRLSSALESTTKFAKSRQIGKRTMSVNTQLRKTILSETKSLIKEKYCSNCGYEIDADSTFCDNCGNGLT